MPVLLTTEAVSRFERIANQNGFPYVPGLLKQMLETLSMIEPDRYQEALVAAKQAGKKPDPVTPRPVGRPPLQKVS